MRWLSGCRSCCARDVPTPRALTEITADIWKSGMFEPAASARSGLFRSAPASGRFVLPHGLGSY
eukprot:4088904-Pyramimonas_sp.AAC.1